MSRLILFCLLLAATTPALGRDLSALVKACGPAVVVVRDAQGEVRGSGVLVSRDGIVLTAEHLFDDGEEFSIALVNGTVLPVQRLIYRNAEQDLVALEVRGQNLPYVPLTPSESLDIGAPVVAIGNPQGLENSVSEGVLSGKRDFGNQVVYLQTTAAISPGSSGGGLFDRQGRLVGILTSYRDDGQNLNFAVPAEYADLSRLRALDRAIQEAPSRWEGYQQRAQAYHDLEEFELALADLRSALAIAPDHPQCIRLRGEIAYRQERHEDALRDFQFVVERLPNEARSYFDRGYEYYSLRRFEEAVADFRTALAKEPTHELAYIWLARSLWQLDRYEEAVEAWTGALKRDPLNATYLANRAQCHYFLDNTTAAAEDVQVALQIDSTNALACLYAGHLLMDQENYEEALVFLDIAVDSADQTPSYRYWRAFCHNSLQNYEKALADLDRSLELNGDHAAARALRGDVFYNLGRFERAIAEYHRSLEYDPERFVVYLDRGDAYAQLGQFDAARADYQHVITASPGSELATQAKERLERLSTAAPR